MDTVEDEITTAHRFCHVGQIERIAADDGEPGRMPTEQGYHLEPEDVADANSSRTTPVSRLSICSGSTTTLRASGSRSLARTGRIDKLSGGVCKSDDFAAVKERLATFMAGGFMALRERNKGKEPKTARRTKQPATRR